LPNGSRRSRTCGGFGSVKIEFGCDWSEFLRLLISHHVRFVLVGSHAVAGHGEPRLTDDLDIFVDVSVTNAKKLRRVLLDFGFGQGAPSAEQLAQPGKIWMLGRKPWRIDLLTVPTTSHLVAYAQAYA
jgi:hypothetical protein